MRLILFLAALLVAAPARAGGLEQLQRFLESTTAARGAFSQTVVSRAGRKPQQSAGIFAFQRPGKFRWSYELPYQQLLVSDGRQFWSYDPELKQAVRKPIGKALAGSPAALLAGGDLQRHFELRDGGEGEGLEYAEATPREAEASFTRIRIGLRDSVPVTMEVQDSFGQTTQLRFTRFERNPMLDPGLFRFVLPAGADVIGE